MQGETMIRKRFAVCALGALILLLSGVASAAQEVPRDPQQYFFDESFWDLTEELQTARDQGKQGILIMFEMDECPFCHRMKNTVLNQPDVQAYFKEHFLILPIDIEGDIEMVNFRGEPTIMKDFAFEEFRVRATPVFAFFDLDGNKLTKYTGATRDADEFLLLGQYVVEKAYERTSFTRYKREKKKAAAQ